MDISPNHLRTAAGYIDRNGVRHLIADFITADRKTTATWSASLHSFRATDKAPFEHRGAVLRPGDFDRENPTLSSPDCHGAASPAVLVLDRWVVLAYAGRGRFAPTDRPNVLAGPQKPDHLPSSVMLAAAPADGSGAPIGPFVKLGAAITPGAAGVPPFASLRVDHPAIALCDGQLHLLFTAYDSAIDLSRRVLGRARCTVSDLMKWIEARAASDGSPASSDSPANLFTIDPSPLLAVEGGGEAPRLFRHDGAYHLFYRHFDRSAGSRWRHYLSADLEGFTLHDPHLFDGLSDAENDVTVLTDARGYLAPGQNLYVSGKELECYKQWSFELRTGR